MARAQELRRRIYIVEAPPHSILHANSGWGIAAAQDSAGGKPADHLGGYVGSVAAGRQRWIFALNIHLPTPGDMTRRERIVRAVRRQPGALPIGA